MGTGEGAQIPKEEDENAKRMGPALSISDIASEMPIGTFIESMAY
jgi:hypothetical protein